MPENHTPLSCFKIDGLKFASKSIQKPSIFVSKIITFPNQSLSYSLSINPKARCIKSCWPCIDCAYETLLPNYSREYFHKVKTKKKKHRSKNSLYYTEKISRFVRVFFKILYTLFTFHFTIEKIPLYNTEKKLGFVDVFWEKIYKLFSRKKRFATKCRANLFFYIVYPSKMQR